MKSSKFFYLFLCSFLFLSGCQTKTNAELPTSSNQTSSSEFPKELRCTLSDKISVNAKCIYPPECKNGSAKTVQLDEPLLWDKKEEIKELFFQGKETKKIHYDYDTSEETIYTADNQTTHLSFSSLNYIDYGTKLSIYIQNVLYTDDRFSDYNGDVYQIKTDLPFMSQENAWKHVQEFLTQLGVEVSEPTCYVMDHKTMQTEEERLAKEAEASDMKPVRKDTPWIDADDCYCFTARTSWNGYPVLPVMSGEGISEENVMVLYNKDGIQALSIGESYPLKEEQEISIQSPEAILEKIQNLLENIISEDSYEIQEITLCQKVSNFDSKNHKAQIFPVWECKILVRNALLEGDSYYQKLYFHAETLKNID